MLALFDNLGFSELLVVLAVAILFFGKRLPEVASEVGTQIAKFRRSLQDIKNETRIDEDLRKIQRDIQSAIPRDLSMGEMARIASAELEKRMRATDPVDAARATSAASKPTLLPEKSEGASDANASSSASASSEPSSVASVPSSSSSSPSSPASASSSSSSAPSSTPSSPSNEESLARGATVERTQRSVNDGARES